MKTQGNVKCYGLCQIRALASVIELRSSVDKTSLLLWNLLASHPEGTNRFDAGQSEPCIPWPRTHLGYDGGDG